MIPKFILKLFKNKLDFPKGNFSGEEISKMLEDRATMLTTIKLVLDLFMAVFCGLVIIFVLWLIAGEFDTIHILFGFLAMLLYVFSVNLSVIVLYYHDFFIETLVELVTKTAVVKENENESK